MKNQKLLKITLLTITFIFLTFPSIGVAQRNAKNLAVKDGYTLTNDNVQVYVKLLQFVIGQKIKPSEIGEIRAEAIKEFNEDPKKFFDEMNQWDSTMNQLYKMSDPIQIADGRMMFIREFYKYTQTIAAKDLPAIVKIANRYVKVLQYNPQTQLVLTNKDIDAVLSYIDFSRKLGGFSALTYSEKQNFRQYLPNYYTQLPAQYQAVFSIMPIVWETIDGQWKRMTPNQKQRVIAQFKAQNIQQNVPQYQPVNPGGAYQNQQQMQQQQQLYQTLSNMSRSSHMTTMNILENIGDGGGYWKMSDNL